MGLDMYLKRANKIDLEKYRSLSEEQQRETNSPWTKVAQWRKANQIRQWFVENCGYPQDGNCDEAEVTKTDLEKLVNLCKEIREIYIIADKKFGDCENLKTDYLTEKFEKMLPTTSGFYFGSTEYDEYYMYDIDETIEQCEKIIAETNWKEEIVIYTDWW